MEEALVKRVNLAKSVCGGSLLRDKNLDAFTFREGFSNLARVFYCDSDNLFVQGDVCLPLLRIKKLPDSLTIKGYLKFYHCELDELPNNLKIEGDLIIEYTDVKKLPKNLRVGGNLRMWGTDIKEIPDDLVVGGIIYYPSDFPLEGRREEDICFFTS